jgi:hypothetical protein
VRARSSPGKGQPRADSLRGSCRWREVALWLVLLVLAFLWTFKAHAEHKHVPVPPRMPALSLKHHPQAPNPTMEDPILALVDAGPATGVPRS